MHWSWLALPVVLLAATNAEAQPHPAPKPPKKPKGWNELEVEPDTPKPDPAPPKPPPPTDSPYRPAPAQPEPPPPPADSSGQKQIITANASEGEPEAIAWMRTWKPRFAVRHVRAEFEAWDHDLGTSFMWDVAMSVGVDDVPVFLDIDLPWTYFDADTPRLNPETNEMVGGHTHIGNTTIGIHGGGVAAKVIGFWGGAWFGIPSGKAISLLDQETLLAAFSARNGVEGHRFFPDTIPFRWAFGIEGQLYPLVYLRSDFFTTILFPNAKLDDEGAFIGGTFEQIHELEVLSPVGAGAGLRYQMLANVASSIADVGIHGVEPYFLYNPPYVGPYAFDLFARLGFLFSVNEVPQFQTFGSVLTIRTQVGYRF